MCTQKNEDLLRIKIIGIVKGSIEHKTQRPKVQR